jgi:hypothetical protein
MPPSPRRGRTGPQEGGRGSEGNTTPTDILNGERRPERLGDPSIGHAARLQKSDQSSVAVATAALPRLDLAPAAMRAPACAARA